MKNLIIVLFAVLFVSCGNKKAEIVEQIKLFKDSSRIILDSIVRITVDESLMQEKLFYTNGQMDHKKFRDSKNRKVYEDYQEKNRTEQLGLKFKKSVYQNKIDSLELELKKY
jgi:hypothetical protein